MGWTWWFWRSFPTCLHHGSPVQHVSSTSGDAGSCTWSPGNVRRVWRMSPWICNRKMSLFTCSLGKVKFSALMLKVFRIKPLLVLSLPNLGRMRLMHIHFVNVCGVGFFKADTGTHRVVISLALSLCSTLTLYFSHCWQVEGKFA